LSRSATQILQNVVAAIVATILAGTALSQAANLFAESPYLSNPAMIALEAVLRVSTRGGETCTIRRSWLAMVCVPSRDPAEGDGRKPQTARIGADGETVRREEFAHRSAAVLYG
jgi:hypothetical protein